MDSNHYTNRSRDHIGSLAYGISMGILSRLVMLPKREKYNHIREIRQSSHLAWFRYISTIPRLSRKAWRTIAQFVVADQT